MTADRAYPTQRMVNVEVGLRRRVSRSPTDWALGTGFSILLGGIAPFSLTVALRTPVDPAWLSLATIVLAGTRLGWIIGTSQRRLVEMSFWLFTYVFMGLAPAVQLRAGITPGTTPGVSPGLNTQAALIVLLGAAAFVTGTSLRAGRGDSSLGHSGRVVRVGRARLLATAGLLTAGYYIFAVGLQPLFASRESRDAVTGSLWPNPTTNIILAAAVSMFLLVAFVALLQVRYALPRAERPFPVMAVLVAIVLLTVVNPISSPRYVFGTVTLGILAAFGAYATRGRFRLAACGVVVGLIVIFPVADAFRYEGSAYRDSSAQQIGPLGALTSGDFDAFAQINNTVAFVDKRGATMGRQALGVALFWVPRAAWEGKPEDTGIVLAESRGYQFTNLSAPLWAELYINGGWTVLLLGMLAFGWFARSSDDRILSGLSAGRRLGVFASILPFYLILTLRGSLLQSMAYLAVIGFSGWLVHDSTRSASS